MTVPTDRVVLLCLAGYLAALLSVLGILGAMKAKDLEEETQVLEVELTEAPPLGGVPM